MTEFRERYQLESRTVLRGADPAKGKKGYYVRQEVWDERRLEDVRHRVAKFAHAVRKTDPGVRELFKGIDPLIQCKNREVVTALREIAAGKIGYQGLNNVEEVEAVPAPAKKSKKSS